MVGETLLLSSFDPPHLYFSHSLTKLRLHERQQFSRIVDGATVFNLAVLEQKMICSNPTTYLGKIDGKLEGAGKDLKLIIL